METERTPEPSSAAPDHRQLVAYLDGELDAEATRRVERALADDPAVREELKRLEEAWSLLDELPRADPDDGFTRSTIAMVAMAAEADSQQERRAWPWRRARFWMAASAGVMAAGLAGFALVRWNWPDPNSALLEDLPVIQHVDEYHQAGEIEFLRTLRDSGMFVDSAEASGQR